MQFYHAYTALWAFFVLTVLPTTAVSAELDLQV